MNAPSVSLQSSCLRVVPPSNLAPLCFVSALRIVVTPRVFAIIRNTLTS